MTRKDEVEKNNKILIEKIKEEATNSKIITQEQVINYTLSSIAQQLVDISVTLAIIADKLGREMTREEAIKALEQEPCEDVISRADVLKVINKMDIPEDMSVFEIKSHIGVEIGTLPPATPKRKVGEWIKKNNDYFDWYECSECGYGSDGEMKYNRLCDVRTKFCPDCGSQNLKGE